MLDEVRELERRDDATAAAIEAAASVERALDELRARAAATAELLARLPAERRRVAAARDDADAALGAARTALEAAEEGSRADAEPAVERAEARLVEAHAAIAAVEREGERAEAERAEVDEAAAALAARVVTLERIHAVEPPRAGLAGALDWASRARAAVFVARSGLEQERERIVREAEELGVALIGEQVYTVRALVERVSGT